MQFEDMSEDELDMHAHNAAEFLWCTVGDPASPKLTESDFEAVLDSSEDAQFAFQLFDVNGDGFVVESEVHERFEAVYRYIRTPKTQKIQNAGNTKFHLKRFPCLSLSRSPSACVFACSVFLPAEDDQKPEGQVSGLIGD